MSGNKELLLSYYSDDFTGSTDAMEAMAAAGVPTVLFLTTPTPDMLAKFPDARCIGIAGSSRGRSPEWMEAELPKVFSILAGMGAPILHYKVCSTFDSSPSVGSIGRAIDLGTKAMPGRWSPTIIGSPRLARYQVFGNLFAAVGGVAYRLDRHPTMSRHPVTPMGESDLRRHLAAQTSRRIELIDVLQLRQEAATERLDTLIGKDVPVILIDVMDEETLAAAGRLAWERRGAGLFSASSSGLGYALTAYWRQIGLVPEEVSLPQAAAVPAIAVVSGSCSPVTASQIAWARARGFQTERMHLPSALHVRTREGEIERLADAATAALGQGISPVIFTAEGPDDETVSRFDQSAQDAGLSRPDAARAVGVALAGVMKKMLDRARPGRIVIAGGDSSGEIVNALNIQALTVAAGLTPGAPLCRTWSDDESRDGLEIVLKGGQIGDETFFGQARAGTAVR
jgi:3-oxoisoapionate kinase